MNGKQAKSLRRVARAMSEMAGAPWEAYQIDSTPSVRFQGGMAPLVRLHPGCGKTLYRTFKRDFKRLARKEGAAMRIIQKLRRGV